MGPGEPVWVGRWQDRDLHVVQQVPHTGVLQAWQSKNKLRMVHLVVGVQEVGGKVGEQLPPCCLVSCQAAELGGVE